jgi:hypothetical protein
VLKTWRRRRNKTVNIAGDRKISAEGTSAYKIVKSENEFKNEVCKKGRSHKFYYQIKTKERNLMDITN